MTAHTATVVLEDTSGAAPVPIANPEDVDVGVLYLVTFDDEHPVLVWATDPEGYGTKRAAAFLAAHGTSLTQRARAAVDVEGFEDWNPEVAAAKTASELVLRAEDDAITLRADPLGFKQEANAWRAAVGDNAEIHVEDHAQHFRNTDGTGEGVRVLVMTNDAELLAWDYASIDAALAAVRKALRGAGVRF